MSHKTVIVIAGPTAVGKTAFAYKLAEKLRTSIISADSRQCFKELNIGVAKPSEYELKKIPHYFINSHSIHEPMNAVLYEKYALKAAGEIFEKNDFAIMVGGTGLYIRAFTDGIDHIPDIKPEIRKELQEIFDKKGVEGLQKLIKKEDPLYVETGENKNPHRILRALEVKRGTGKSIKEFQQGKQKERPFKILKYMLNQKRVLLYEQINNRVDAMINAGLLKEVASLVEYRDLPPLQTVGYSEIFNFIDGNISLEEAIELVKRNTRRYAKRQLTWFRKEPGFIEIAPNEITTVLKTVMNM